MSASAAMSRKKAAAGVTSKPTPQHAQKFGEVEDTPKEISPNQLLVQHDYKLHVFENKIKELHERTTFLSKNLNSEGGLSTVNENMLTEALQAMDQRLDNLEEGLTKMWEWAKQQPMRERFVWPSYELEKGIYSYWKNKK